MANPAHFRNIRHMRKRYAFPIAILLLAFVAALIWQLSPPREPVYEGRPLSYWLEGYSIANISETAQQSADTAMRAIGTNAIPTLLRMLQKDDSPLKLEFFALVEKQHFMKIHHVLAPEINYEGLKGFEVLGASARDAVPSLIEIYEHPDSGASKTFAALSLGAIGPSAKEAVPLLLQGLWSTNVGTRSSTMRALVLIHSKPELVVPVLIKQLNDNTEVNDHYSTMAVETLSIFGTNAKPAIPTLIKLLNDPDPHLHAAALLALKQIDPQTAASLSANPPPAQTPP